MTGEARDWARRPRDRFFVGRRRGDARVLVVSPQGVGSLPHYRRLSPEPFDWGRHGEGVYELAYSLLAEIADARPPAAVCGLLEVEVVAWLPWRGFTLHERDVAAWLAASVSEEQRATWPSRDARPFAPPGRVRRPRRS